MKGKPQSRTNMPNAGAPASLAPAALPLALGWTTEAGARDYALSLGIVALTTALSFAMRPYFALSNVIMLYLLAVAFVAARGAQGPAVLASVVSVAVFDFCFVPPRWTFAVEDFQYVVTFGVMLVVALLISGLALRLRRQAEAARLMERRTAAIHALSREFASLRGTQAILDAAARHIGDVFDSRVVALLPDAEGRLQIRAGDRDGFMFDEKERSTAQWTYDLGEVSGRGAAYLPFLDAFYVPMFGSSGAIGALRVRPLDSDRPFGGDHLQLLESLAHQAGLALEVDRLEEKFRRSEVEAETERLRSSLLSSVSHDLRTPLAAIVGSASGVLETEAGLGSKARELIQGIYDEGVALERLVHNLLQATRIEAGGLRLQREPCSVEEVLGAALNRLERLLGERPVEARLPEDLPLVAVDAALLEQVFVNLVENAAKYAPSDKPIEIEGVLREDRIEIQVADRGPGLSQEALERAFSRFYRGEAAAGRGGSGLGLAICRGIVEAHGGKIWVENRSEGGASFRFSIPADAPEDRGSAT